MRVVVTLTDGEEIVHEGPHLGLRTPKVDGKGDLLVLKLSPAGAVLGTIERYEQGRWSRAKLHRDKFHLARAPIYVPSKLVH